MAETPRISAVDERIGPSSERGDQNAGDPLRRPALSPVPGHERVPESKPLDRVPNEPDDPPEPAPPQEDPQPAEPATPVAPEPSTPAEPEVPASVPQPDEAPTPVAPQDSFSGS